MSKYIRAKITENTPVNKDHNLLALSPDDIPQRPLPGQFYMIGTDYFYDPLLKRPFSIFRETAGELQFLYRIKGKGTERMKEMRKGDTVKVMKGFFCRKTGKILEVDMGRMKIYIEGMQRAKQDGSKVNVPLEPSNLMITEMNLDDKKRNAAVERNVKSKAEKAKAGGKK